MSTGTLTRPAAAQAAGGDALAGTGTLLRFALRRDRVRLVIWILAIGALATSTVSSLQTTYPTAADRQARAELMANPAAVMLSGPSFGLDDYTLGAMVANESTLWLVFLAGIMSITLVVRHTRAEEESGRAELVRAGVVGRHTQLTAAMLLLALANTAAAVVIAGGLTGTGLDAAGSLAV
ncbi:MAG TPA: ABC transporter permease, partial [Pseudonocardia sp.]|nr:ABC transporter permease [Pseudonocardia sp.]